MPRLVARILLSGFIIPVAGLLYPLVIICIWDVSRRDRELRWFFAGGVVWMLIAVVLFLIWRKHIAWTRRRIVLTLAAAGPAIIVAAGLGVIADRFEHEIGRFFTSVFAPAFWLLALPLIWRDTAAEQAQRTAPADRPLLCPKCGYNLTGLTEARCPECGAAFTLDQLYAAQADSTPAQLRG